MTTDTLEALREAREAIVSAIEDIENRDEGSAYSTLKAALSRIDAALAPDHIGNSTTMVPALGVEGVAQAKIELALVAYRNRMTTLEAATDAIIAAMEKNDG